MTTDMTNDPGFLKAYDLFKDWAIGNHFDPNNPVVLQAFLQSIKTVARIKGIEHSYSVGLDKENRLYVTKGDVTAEVIVDFR